MVPVVREASFLTVKETAALLKQSERSIRRKIHAGTIPGIRLGDETGPLRVDEADLKAWLAQSRVTPAERRAPDSEPAVEARPLAGQKGDT